MSWPFVAFGITSSRSVSTRSTVASVRRGGRRRRGETAAVPASLTSGSVTSRRPPSSRCRRAGPAAAGRTPAARACLRWSSDCWLISSSCFCQAGLHLGLGLLLRLVRRQPLASTAPRAAAPARRPSSSPCPSASFSWSLILSRFAWSGLAGFADRSTLTSSGPLEPAPKPARHDVVGLARLGALRQRAVVLLAELEARRRDREREQDRPSRRSRTAAGAWPRSAAQRCQPCGFPSCHAVGQREAPRVDAGAEQPQQGGQQRDRGQHRDRDDDRRRVAERRDERDARRWRATAARSSPCSRRRPRRRPTSRSRGRPTRRWPSRRAAAPVPGDYEERVVDPDAEADHRRQRRRGGRDLGDVADQRDDRQADDEADDRGDDRHPHRHDRAEREQQDDDRHARGRRPPMCVSGLETFWPT